MESKHRAILMRKGANVSVCDEDGEIHKASKEGRESIVLLKISYGANV